MTAKISDTHRPSAEEVLAAAPPVRHEPAAREHIRAAHAAAGRRIAALDDDPTGSQTVHDVSVVTVFEDAEYAAALAEPGSTCFVLTNTRSLPEDAAVELTSRVAGSLFTLGQTLGAPVEVVSRSDSTLRGHVLAEMQAIDAARRRVTGTGFDGVLLVPAYFEAGRFTAGDIHWAMVSGEPVPVGATRVRQGRHLRLHLVEPAGIRRREEQRHDHRGPGPLHLADRHPRGRTRPGRRHPRRGHRRRVRRGQRHRLRRPGDRRPGRASGTGAGQVVRLPLWSVVPPCSGRARTSRPAHRGADLADRSSRRPGARCRRFACWPDQPAGRQGAGTWWLDRNRTATSRPCWIPTGATPTSPPSGGRSSRPSPPPMCCCSPAVP